MDHWTESFENLQKTPQHTWREYCDKLNGDLIAGWLADKKPAAILKTDLFEEAIGSGLCSSFRERGNRIFGIDCSMRIAATACTRTPGFPGTVADVQQLPFAAKSFDVVISTSTLDHFASRSELVQSMRELARVLRPGGLLILTLDNLGNPLIRLRQLLPFRLLYKLRILPYFTGYTCTLGEFRSLLTSTGFVLEQTAALAHCPRLPAIVLARWADKYASVERRLQLRSFLLSFEKIAFLRTRFITGNYFAVRAVRQRP